MWWFTVGFSGYVRGACWGCMYTVLVHDELELCPGSTRANCVTRGKGPIEKGSIVSSVLMRPVPVASTTLSGSSARLMFHHIYTNICMCDGWLVAWGFCG